MRTRSLTPIISLLAALVLAAGTLAPAIAQDESAEPSLSPTIVEQLEERRIERAAAREERRIDRAAKREESKAKREIAKAERAAKRDERQAMREKKQAVREKKQAYHAQKKAAWAEAREACKAELALVRAESPDDRTARKAAWHDAKAACKDAFASIKAASGDKHYAKAASDASGVVRTDLGIAEPGSAAGQDLGLWHYLIPAGQELAAHTHPGWQLARVTAGELEYTVVEGEGVLLRADGSREPMGPGTYVLAVGDGVIENPTLIHLGANRTDKPVTIISATLFESGEPIATVVEEGE